MWLLIQPLFGMADISWTDKPVFIGTQDGLPQSSVRALAIDHEDFLWVGTENGLARYDGHRFIDFSRRLEGIPTDVALTMMVDGSGRIWTSWYRHSVRALLPDRQSVLEVEPAENQPLDLSDIRTEFVEDPAGSVWFRGKTALYRVDPTGAQYVVELPGDSLPVPGLLIAGDWLFMGSTRAIGLLDWRSEKPELRKLSWPKNPTAKGPGSPRDYEVTKFMLHGERVIALSRSGISRINPQGLEVESLLAAPQGGLGNCILIGDSLLVNMASSRQASSRFYSLDLVTGELRQPWPGLPAEGRLLTDFRDRDGGIWAVINGQLYYSKPGIEAFRKVAMPAPVYGNMPPFTQGKNGPLFMGTDGGGIARFSPYGHKFQTVYPGEEFFPGKSRQVRRIATDAADNVWLATEERGILYWDRQSDVWKRYLSEIASPIKDIVVLKDGSVWATATHLGAIMRYEPSLDRWSTALESPHSSVALTRTLDGDKLLVAGRNFRVEAVDPSTREIETLYEGAYIRETLAQTRALTVDGNGTVWVGTHGAGFGRIDGPQSARFWHSGNSAISSDLVFAIHSDRQGMLWIGTWHGGLWRLHPGTGALKHFGSDEGLPMDTVFGILDDDQGYLWLSGYLGLARFKPCNSQPGCKHDITLFNQFDGLQSEEFDAEGFYQSEQGELFFGGSGGLNAFYPDQVRTNPQVPDIHVTDVRLNSESLTSNTVDPDPLELPYEFGELEIDLSSLDLHEPRKNRYQYRDLDDLDGWHDLDGPALRVRNLSDGRHRLQFRGSNNDGLWSAPSAPFTLNVSPPLYRHPAVLAGYAFLLLAAPTLFFRWRQSDLWRQHVHLEQQIRRRTQELQTALTARERFFANISHEIAAPVHMILLMLENHVESNRQNDRTLYRSATGYAAQLMVYLRQLIADARQREADHSVYAVNPGELVRRLVEVNDPVARARGIEVAVGEFPPGQVAMGLAASNSVFSNLLCNALIYTPENGRIKLSGELRGGIYRVTIENDTEMAGKLDIDTLLQRGERGQFDPTTIGGHGLGLSIVTDMLGQLGGRLDRLIREDGWVVFHVDLPLCDDRLPPLPSSDNLAFSREQKLAIELVHSGSELPVAEKGQGEARVLVIEDDRNVARLLSGALRKNFDVSTAGTCADGIRAAFAQVPDVVVCDLFLPDQPGLEAVRALRENRMTRDCFIIMVTASLSESDRQAGVRLGVDQFLSKPVAADTLRLMIRTHTRLARQRISSERTRKLQLASRKQRIQQTGTDFPDAWQQAMEELYSDPDTTVKDFQERLSMSYGSLVRACKQAFGSPPRRLLIERRVRAAQKSLSSGDLKIGQIAEMSGFSSHSQFTVSFRKITGQSPAQYRATARQV